MNPTRILVADDHELIRDGLRKRIESHPEWTVCAEATDGRQAVEMTLRLKPDLVVLDIGMPDLNGIDAARQIHKACPNTPLLILTMMDSDDLVRDALAAGALGFLLKTDAARLLPTAIESLLAGKPYFTGRVAEIVLAGFLSPKESSTSSAQLTPREREIVQLLAEAHTSKEVAAQLGISIKTIEAHRANIMHKLHLHSVAELVRYAVRNHIISP